MPPLDYVVLADLLDFFYRINKIYQANIASNNYRVQRGYSELEELSCNELQSFVESKVTSDNNIEVAGLDINSQVFYMGVLFYAPHAFDHTFIAVLPLGDKEKIFCLDQKSDKSVYLESGNFVESFVSLQNMIIKKCEAKSYGSVVVPFAKK